MAIFGKTKKKEEKKETPKEFGEVGRPSTDIDVPLSSSQHGSVPAAQRAVNIGSGTLKGFYISEKATGLAPLSQYVFKVFNSATKNEVKKQVERNFSVKVKGVKIINLPRKRRNVGRHKGFKSGFKKAIVVLEKGNTIDQAKA